MKARYRNPAIKQLKEQQVRYAPRDVKLKQIDSAERLLVELDSSKDYPYHRICEQITSYRPERYPDLVITGAEAAHDLRCFVEDLSESIDISADSQPEPVLTVQDVSARYNVSTKTVDRWRERGLVSRRFRFGNRTRVGFLESTVEQFVARNSAAVERGAKFTQLTLSEREEVIRRARRLARHGGSVSDISRRLSRRLGRSQETIRYTLKNFDEKYPENAVFPDATGPLSDNQRSDIFRAFKNGMSVEQLAERYHRTKTSIYRIVSEVRATRLLDQPIDFMFADEFLMEDADNVIIHADPPVVEKKTAKAPPGLPPYLASLYAIPLLTREEEGYFFRKMNYLKFKARKVQEKIDPARPRSKQMDQIDELIEQSLEIKNFLIRSNLRLVVSIAKRHIRPNSNFFEMVSDGNMSLIRAIEKFDYTKGNKFSTYSSWAIMKNFARSIPNEHTQLDRFRTGNDEIFAYSQDQRSSQFQQERVNKTQKHLISGILGELDHREREIIVHRFGLEKGSECKTLEQVGQRFGVTKERIRQLEARALQKLRKIVQQKKLDIPGL